MNPVSYQSFASDIFTIVTQRIAHEKQIAETCESSKWDQDSLIAMVQISYTLSLNTGLWEIDIHDCYSLVKIAFVPICTWKNNRQIWRHNASVLPSRDVTDQIRWRHNTKPEKTVLRNNDEISDR